MKVSRWNAVLREADPHDSSFPTDPEKLRQNIEVFISASWPNPMPLICYVVPQESVPPLNAIIKRFKRAICAADCSA
jgi:hypothetical protein